MATLYALREAQGQQESSQIRKPYVGIRCAFQDSQQLSCYHLRKQASHMERHSLRERMRHTMASLKRLLKREEPEPPDDPYAMVTAPKKPRLPHRSAAVADEPER
ncbi:MAG: hypothetical protein WBQ65_02720 [Bryobacteraceae bacterium]